MGTKGQVVIPKAIREEIGIRPGDEVTFEPDGQDVRVRRVKDDEAKRTDGVRALRGAWTDGGGGTSDLIEERRREREAEESKAQRWGVGSPR